MSILHTLFPELPAWWYFFSWRDAIEISLFSWVLYHAINWFKQDSNQWLLHYLYGYIGLLTISYLTPLPTLHYYLIFFAPALIMIFIIMHQSVLQRNIIAYKNITTPLVPIEKDWIALLIRMSLITNAHKKPFTCIIEHRDNLMPFIVASYMMHSPLHQGLLEFIMHSSLYMPHELLWITSKGIIRGINGRWLSLPHTAIQEKSLLSWEDEAAAYTAKTDALVLHKNIETNTFSVIIKGISTHNLATHQIVPLIKKHIHYVVDIEKGAHYDWLSKKETTQQHTY